MRTDFVEMLKNNGIRIPEKKEWMPNWLFEVRQEIFRKKWRKALVQYNYFKDNLEFMRKIWKACDEQLEVEFDKQMSPFPNVEIRKFSNPSEAVIAIREADSELESKDLCTEKRQIEYKCMKEWYEKIVTQMPENCNLIVVKSSINIPDSLREKAFQENVAAGKEDAIMRMGVAPIWIAFKPDSKQNPEMWIIRPKEATVEYI